MSNKTKTTYSSCFHFPLSMWWWVIFTLFQVKHRSSHLTSLAHKTSLMVSFQQHAYRDAETMNCFFVCPSTLSLLFPEGRTHRNRFPNTILSVCTVVYQLDIYTNSNLYVVVVVDKQQDWWNCDKKMRVFWILPPVSALVLGATTRQMGSG